jgi:hypothetical protein
VSEYQYCSSHHAGEMISVTDKAFFGGLRKRSSGDRVSCSGSIDKGCSRNSAFVSAECCTLGLLVDLEATDLPRALVLVGSTSCGFGSDELD